MVTDGDFRSMLEFLDKSLHSVALILLLLELILYFYHSVNWHLSFFLSLFLHLILLDNMYPSIHNYHHHHHPYHFISSYPNHHHHHPRSHFPINLPSIQSLLQEIDGQAYNPNPLTPIDLTLPPLKSSFDPNPNLNYFYFQDKIDYYHQPNHHQISNPHRVNHDSYQTHSNLNQVSKNLHSNQTNCKLSSKAILNRPKRKQVKRACQNCQKACKGCADSRPCPRCVLHGLTNTCRDAPRKSERLKSPISSSASSSSTTSLHSPASSSSSDLSDSSLSNQIKNNYQRPNLHSNIIIGGDRCQHISIKCSNVFTNQTTQNLHNIQTHQNHPDF